MKKNLNQIDKEFNSLESDVEKWQWVRDNQDSQVVVMLDNDDTYAIIEDDDDDEPSDLVLQFDNYIGNADGVGYLLESMGIAYSEV